MSGKHKYPLFQDEIHEERSTFLDSFFDTLGGSDFDIYANLKAPRYPVAKKHQHWNRVGEYLNKAIEVYEKQENKG